MIKTATQPLASRESEEAAVTKAVIRAADRLAVTQATLAAILGVSAPTISRMANGNLTLQRSSKEFELAVLFVQLYRSLDAVVGGDDTVSQEWIQNFNTALKERPITLIKTVPGLVNVIQYLDARRAIV